MKEALGVMLAMALLSGCGESQHYAWMQSYEDDFTVTHLEGDNFTLCTGPKQTLLVHADDERLVDGYQYVEVSPNACVNFDYDATRRNYVLTAEDAE